MSSRACVFFAALLLGACKDEFPNAPPLTFAIDTTADWHDTVAVTDVDTLHIKVTLPGGGSVTGVQVHWESSNPAKLEVTPLTIQAGQEKDSLILQLRTVITAHARDSAVIITATVDRPGFQPKAFSRQITVMERWIAVSAGYQHSCGVTVDGTPYCWGTGLLGNGSTASSSIPVRVIGELKFSSIMAGDGYTCGLLLDKRAYCWGSNARGSVGISLPHDELVPAPVSLGQTFASFSAGRHHACGIADGLGFCWGDNLDWELGDAGLSLGSPVPPFDTCLLLTPIRCSLSPRRVRDSAFIDRSLLAIGPGVTHTCAILTDRDAICWGFGSAVLGSDTVALTDSMAPVVIPLRGGFKFVSVTAGLSHNCGLRDQDSVALCWGLDSYGQLGTSSPGATCPSMGLLVGCSALPLAVPDGHKFLHLEAGENSTCGIDADSIAYCWGSNQFGQLGTLIAPDTCEIQVNCGLRPSRVHLPGDPKTISISVGRSHACAVTLQGAAYCWGEPAGGKLGNAVAPGGTVPVAPLRVSEPQ